MNQPIWELTAIKYADSRLPDRMAFAGGRGDCFHPIVFVIYCIRVGQRLILVDPGCDALPGFEMKNFIAPVEALAQKGITPDSVTDIIITHAHHDHIDAVRHFPGSVIHIQKEEYAAGRQYIPHTYPVDEHTVVADCVNVLRIGGHTCGSSIVTLSSSESTWVLCGDECYLRANLERSIPIGTSKCPENSRRFLSTYADDRYRVLICHDPQDLEKEFADGCIIGV